MAQTDGARSPTPEELELEIIEDKKRRQTGLVPPTHPEGMKIDGVSSSGESQTRLVTYHGGENLPNIVERSAGPVEQACRKQ